MRDLIGEKGDQWLRGRMAAAFFGAVAALELVLLAAVTVASIRGRYSSYGELLPAIIVDSVVLFSGMYRHMTHTPGRSERSRGVWSFVLLYAILIGPIVYYGLVFLPSVRATGRSK
jgi:hypothetical protein